MFDETVVTWAGDFNLIHNHLTPRAVLTVDGGFSWSTAQFELSREDIKALAGMLHNYLYHGKD